MSLFKKYISIIQEASYSKDISSISDENIFCFLIDEDGKKIHTIYKKISQDKLGKDSSSINDSLKSFLLKLKNQIRFPHTDIVLISKGQKINTKIEKSDKINSVFKKLGLTTEEIKKALEELNISVSRSMTNNIDTFLSDKGGFISFLENKFVIKSKLDKKNIPFILSQQEDISLLNKFLKEDDITKIKVFISRLFEDDPVDFIIGYKLISPEKYSKLYPHLFSKEQVEDIEFEKIKDLGSKQKNKYQEDESLELNAIEIAKITLDDLNEIVDDAYKSEYNNDEDDKLYSKEEIKKMSLKNFKEQFKDLAPFYGYVKKS